jgi:regulatory protein
MAKNWASPGGLRRRARPSGRPAPVETDAGQAAASPRREQTLQARALALLARREHSRAELARKLAVHAESKDELDRLLDHLEEQHLLSDRRFAEVLTRSRGRRYGAARIAEELKQHGIDAELQREALARLQDSELQRAREVWRRKFGAPAPDAAGRARQMRFLLQRGFAAELARRVVGASED